MPYFKNNVEVYSTKDLLENLDDVMESLDWHVEALAENLKLGRKKAIVDTLEGMKWEFSEGVKHVEDLLKAIASGGELEVPLPRKKF